jgi:hypothetical protein
MEPASMGDVRCQMKNVIIRRFAQESVGTLGLDPFAWDNMRGKMDELLPQVNVLARKTCGPCGCVIDVRGGGVDNRR